MVDINPITTPLTMKDYLRSIKSESLKGVFSFRLSPNTWDHKLTLKEIQEKLTHLEAIPKVLKGIAFEEGTNYGKLDRHYHVRIETLYKTRKSITEIIKSVFPIPEQGGRSSKYFSVHDCQAKDKKFWKGETYIAKNGDCIWNYKYDLAHVALMIYWGRKLQTFSGMTISEQIAILYDINEHHSVEDIYDITMTYFSEEKKKVPTMKQVSYILHSILFKINPEYRRLRKLEIVQEFQQRLVGFL